MWNATASGIMYESMLDPPYEIKGSVIPVIGKIPKTIEIFWKSWKTIIPMIPIIIMRSLVSFDFKVIKINLTSKAKIKMMTAEAPKKPKFCEMTAKMKSV